MNLLSKLEYFAAHAPAVPDWFQCAHIESEDQQSLKMLLIGAKEKCREFLSTARILASWEKDPCFDLEEAGATQEERTLLNAVYHANRNYQEFLAQNKIRLQAERFFAWREYYARKMVGLYEKPAFKESGGYGEPIDDKEPDDVGLESFWFGVESTDDINDVVNGYLIRENFDAMARLLGTRTLAEVGR